MPFYSSCQIFLGREVLQNTLLTYVFRLECLFFLEQVVDLSPCVYCSSCYFTTDLLQSTCEIGWQQFLSAAHMIYFHLLVCLSNWSYVVAQAKIHYSETHMVTLWLSLSITGNHQRMCDVFWVLLCHKFHNQCDNWCKTRLFAKRASPEDSKNCSFFVLSIFEKLVIHACSFSSVSELVMTNEERK